MYKQTRKFSYVFECFMVGVIQKLFKQIRKESSLELSLTFTTTNQ